MDELLLGYIEDNYAPEIQDQILSVLHLAHDFGMNHPESEMLEYISYHGSTESSSISDGIYSEAVNICNYILSQHHIQLTPEASLSARLSFCNALYLLQHLDSYLSVAITLESELSNKEKLASIFSSLSVLTYETTLECLDEFDDILLTRLKEYIDNKESYIEEDEPVNRDHIKDIKLYSEIFGNDNVACELLANGVKLGYGLNNYIMLIDGLEFSSIDEAAVNILGLIMITDAGRADPLMYYRKYNTLLLDSIDDITAVETKLLILIAKFNEHKRAKELEGRA